MCLKTIYLSTLLIYECIYLSSSVSMNYELKVKLTHASPLKILRCT